MSIKYFLIITSILFFSETSSICAKDEGVHYNQINYTVSSSQEVDNDTIVVVLTIQEKGRILDDVTDLLNKKIKAALSKLRKYNDVEIKTLGYNTRMNQRNEVFLNWEVRQSILLKSQNIERVSKLVSSVQDTLTVTSMSYEISDKMREEINNQLIEQAIKHSTHRAKIITSNLKMKNYKIVKISFDNSNGNHPRPMGMHQTTRTTMAERTAPNIIPGTRKITVTANVAIEIAK